MRQHTDWDAYYARPYRTAALTHRLMAETLLDVFRDTGVRAKAQHVVELGGGDSCFYDDISRALQPALYTVVDSNSVSVERFLQRTAGQSVVARKADVLTIDERLDADVVFSVGLIEHFTPADTARAIRSHFALARPGGLVLMTFPTPTLLYKAVRSLSELLGLWIFHDERPLETNEVLSTAASLGEVVYKTLVWKVVLTQGLVALRKPLIS